MNKINLQQVLETKGIWNFKVNILAQRNENGQCKKLHNEELRNLYHSPRKLRWACSQNGSL